MQKEYFKDSESMVDTIFSAWSGYIKTSKSKNLSRSFSQLQQSFDEFREQLEEEGYEGYFKKRANNN